MTGPADRAMRCALTRATGVATSPPARREDTLVDRLARADVTPQSISALVRNYGLEARRAGRLPEEMVIQLKQLYVGVRARLDPAFRRSSRLPAADTLLSFIVSNAIDAYYTTGDANT
jgi:hypothetical protein